MKNGKDLKDLKIFQQEIEDLISSFNDLANKTDHTIRLALWPIEGYKQVEHDEEYYVGFAGSEKEMLDQLFIPNIEEGWLPSRFCY